MVHDLYKVVFLKPFPWFLPPCALKLKLKMIAYKQGRCSKATFAISQLLFNTGLITKGGQIYGAYHK